MGGNGETKVAQNLRAEPVAQSNIFEPNQVQLRSVKGATGTPKPRSRLRLPGTKLTRFCGVYGFRFVNARLVASWSPASEALQAHGSGEASLRRTAAHADHLSSLFDLLRH